MDCNSRHGGVSGVKSEAQMLNTTIFTCEKHKLEMSTLKSAFKALSVVAQQFMSTSVIIPRVDSALAAIICDVCQNTVTTEVTRATT